MPFSHAIRLSPRSMCGLLLGCFLLLAPASFLRANAGEDITASEADFGPEAQDSWLGIGQERMEIANSLVRSLEDNPEGIQDAAFIFVEAADALMRGQESFDPQAEIWGVISDAISMVFTYRGMAADSDGFADCRDILRRMDPFDDAQEFSYEFWKSKATVAGTLAVHALDAQDARALCGVAESSLLQAGRIAEDEDSAAMVSLNLADLFVGRTQRLDAFKRSGMPAPLALGLETDPYADEDEYARLYRQEQFALLDKAAALLEEIREKSPDLNEHTLKVLYSLSTEERLCRALLNDSAETREVLIAQAAAEQKNLCALLGPNEGNYLFSAHVAALRGNERLAISNLSEYRDSSGKSPFVLAVSLNQDVFFLELRQHEAFAAFLDELAAVQDEEALELDNGSAAQPVN